MRDIAFCKQTRCRTLRHLIELSEAAQRNANSEVTIPAVRKA